MVLETPLVRDINTTPEMCMIALKSRFFPFLMKTPQKKAKMFCVPGYRITEVKFVVLHQNKNLEAKDNRSTNLIYGLPCFFLKAKANVLKNT